MFERIRYGKPLFNLEVDIYLEELCLGNFSVLDNIVNYGNAITIAKNHFVGLRYVTEKGAILVGKKDNIPTKEATLDLDLGSVVGLLMLDQYLNNRNEDDSMKMANHIHLHFDEGDISRISTEKDRLYLYDVWNNYIQIKDDEKFFKKVDKFNRSLENALKKQSDS